MRLLSLNMCHVVITACTFPELFICINTVHSVRVHFSSNIILFILFAQEDFRLYATYLFFDLQSFTLLLEQRLNSLIIPLPHPCSVLLLNKTSMSIAQKTHHTLAGIQLSHNNIEWGEGGFKYVFHRV